MDGFSVDDEKFSDSVPDHLAMYSGLFPGLYKLRTKRD